MSRVKLGEVAREYKAVVKDNTNLPSVGLEHLTSGEIALEHWNESTANTFSKGFKRGHVLFGRRRAYLKKAAVAPFDGVCSGDITVIEAIPEKLIPGLLPFIIQNDRFFDYAIGNSAGSLSPRVKWESLKQYEFNLPELNEQAEMVDLLNSAYATKQAYRALFQSTDELIKSQFIEEMSKWENTGEGERIKLGELTKIQTGKLDANASDDKGRYPFFTCAKEPLRIDAYSYDCECVLVAGNGELNAKYYNGKFDAYQRTYIIESKDKDRLSVPFLYRMLSQYVNALQNQSIGSVIKYIKLGMLTEAEFVVPYIDLQNQFVGFANQCDKSKFEIKQAINRIDDLIKSLMLQEA